MSQEPLLPSRRPKVHATRRVAVVTGASTGIGLACAKALISGGIDVLGVARREARLDGEGGNSSGATEVGRFAALSADLTEPGSISLAWDEARRCFGSDPTVWVVNAGRGLPGTLLESDEARWSAMFELNCLSALRQLREAGLRMRALSETERRDIVVLGSVVGRFVSPFNPVYGASKFALHSAVEALRQELAPVGVRVTIIEPGIVRTDFQTTAQYNMATFDAFEEEIGPFLSGEDIAELVIFAISRPAAVSLASIIVRPTRQVTP